MMGTKNGMVKWHIYAPSGIQRQVLWESQGSDTDNTVDYDRRGGCAWEGAGNIESIGIIPTATTTLYYLVVYSRR